MRKDRHVKGSVRRVDIVMRVAAATAASMVVPAVLASVPPPTTRPVDWTNAGGDGVYVNGANWNPAIVGAPANANNEFVTINNGGTAAIRPGDAAEGAFVNVGLRTGDTGTLLITGGTLTAGELRVGGRETVATDLTDWSQGTSGNAGGTGTVIQSGSSVVNVNFTHGNDPDTGQNYEPPVQSTYIGDSGLASGNTADGSYTIKDTAVLNNGLQSSDQLVIGTGPGARGTFTQQDNSTVTSAGTVVVGRRGATGSYTISGGTLSATANNLRIGDGDRTGTVAGTVGGFTQTGGTVNVKGADIGRQGGTGTYTISAGALNLSGQLNIGTTGGSTGSPVVTDFLNPVGTFSLSGTGTVTGPASSNVFIGFNGFGNTYSATASAAGFLNISGGTMSLPNASGILAIGSGTGGTGTVNISGGTLQGTGTSLEIQLGRNAGSGTVNLSGSGLIKTTNFYIGGNAANIGDDAALSMSGGSLSCTNLVLSATDLPDSPSSVRTLNMTGGTVTAATFNQNTTTPTNVTRSATISGGSFTVTGTTTGGKNVTYNFSGGTLSFNTFNLDNSALNISGNANVTLGNYNLAGNMGGSTTVSGGTLNVTGTWRINNNPTTPPGSLTVTGGNVTMASVISGGNAAALNISGGNVSIGSLTLSAGTVFTTDNTISLSSAITLGSSTAASGTTTVNVNSGSLALSGPISIFSGNPSFTLKKTGTGTLTLSGAHSHTAAATLTASAGTLVLNASGGTQTTVNASGGSVSFGVSQVLAAVNVADGSTATLLADGARSLTTPSVNLNSTGTLDLTNNSLVVTYTGGSPVGTLVGKLQSAYAGGAWTGAGLTSTTARDRGDHATGLGYSDNGSQVLVTYTWMGDLNLDKKIDGDDYALIDRQVARFGVGAAGQWQDGDVNYDGVVNVSDYAVMDAAFGHQSGGLSPEFLAMRQAEFGDAYVQALVAAVPEPGCGLILAGAAFSLGVRRRRRG